MVKCDFSGWATRNDLRCADGRIIRKDAFKGQNGKTVSLVWNHQHNSQDNVLGHALLENREDGVYAYCTFNETESGKTAKELVQHGDVVSLSIWANQLKQTGHDVVHGVIRELSLVLAGANPGAFIDTVMVHGMEAEDELIINYDENIMLYHSADDPEKEKQKKDPEPEPEAKKEGEKKDPEPKAEDDETVGDVWNTLTEKQQNAAYAMIAAALEEKEEPDDDDDKDNKGGNKTMKHNVFDQGAVQENTFLSHADQVDIINLAKSNSVGSLRTALNIYLEQNRETLEHSGMDVDDVLVHGIADIEKLFPEFKDVRPGAPERITRDQGWVTSVMSKAYKTPFSRIRTRQMDARSDELRARGYKKGSKKEERGNMTLYNRTTDPQTVFVKDKLNRDDIVDITDFEVADYIYQDMREKLNEEIAIAIMVSDGRLPGAEGKIDETHIRPIWGELFKAMGIWNEDGSVKPEVGDVIVFNWDDSTQPNDGYSDHIGYVEQVYGDTIVCIEGNMNDQVGRRSINVGWGYIRGFAHPKYAKDNSAQIVATAKSIDELANEVLQGAWGNGEARKNAITAAGYDYSAVQKRVNEFCGKDSKKSVDEIAKEVISGAWGNGEARKAALEHAGYNYGEVQKKVNVLVKTTKSSIDAIAREVIAGKWGNGQDRKNRLNQAGYDYVAVQKRVDELM